MRIACPYHLLIDEYIGLKKSTGLWTVSSA